MTDSNQLSALERLTKLRDSGALTESEFDAQKAALLSNGPTLAANVPFYRRLWFVVLLTCLIITFWVALIILATGNVYKRKDGQLVPIKGGTRLVYGGLLAVWAVAIAVKAMVDPAGFGHDWTEAQNTPASKASANTVSSSTAPVTNTAAANVPDKCDSSDAAQMVKDAIENAPGAQLTSVKVADFGHAAETWLDAANNSRHCRGVAYLNSGQAVVAYQLFFGPSGAEMVRVETGDQGEMQIEGDVSLRYEAEHPANPRTEASPTAPDQTQDAPIVKPDDYDNSPPDPAPEDQQQQQRPAQGNAPASQ